jgi:hypothetical protein
MESKTFKNFSIILLIIFLSSFVEGIRINEINYNPINQTYYDEYIEIYSESPINLSEFILCDLSDCDNLILYKQYNSSYYLITTNQSNYRDCDCNIYIIDDSRLGNGLNNDGDCIFLNSSSLNLSFCYNDSIEQGYSLQFFNGSWRKCELSPCQENFCEGEQDFYVEFPKIIFNKNREFPVFIDAKNKSILYDVKIDILANGTRLSMIYDENQKVWKSTYYYVNGINLTNKIFILKINSNFSGQATLEVKIRDYVTYIYPIFIFNIFLDESQNQSQQENESYIKVIDYEVDSSFVKTKLKIYRGNTRKYAVYAYIYDRENNKKVSEDTVVYALDKFIEYNLVLPIKLKEINKSKNYLLVVEGLDLKEQREIFLEKTFQKNYSCYEFRSKEKSYKVNGQENKREINFESFILSYEIENIANKVYFIRGSLKNRGKASNFYVWSYLEDCLSCEMSKEENAISLYLEQNQTKNFELENKAIKNASGFYDLIINVWKEDESIKEIREKVFVDNKLSENANTANIGLCKDDGSYKDVNKDGKLKVFLMALILLIVLFFAYFLVKARKS